MFVDQHGERVQPYRPMDRDGELAERFRDILAVKLHAKRMPFKWIGRVLGMTGESVRKRMEKMPVDAREYYRNAAMDSLVPALAD